MQQELDALSLAVPVKIIGVNEAGYEAGNPSITFGRDIPWLQDLVSVDAWGLWDVEYRDVIIVDPNNEYVDTFNLTVHNLASPTDYDDLKQRLIDASTSWTP